MLPEAQRQQILRTIREVRVDLDELSGIVRRVVEWRGKYHGTEPDEIFVRAAGTLLHDFYNCVETAMQRIAAEVNGGVPESSAWHHQLLADMSLDLPGVRPALLTRELRHELDRYRRFRHFFRHRYGEDLDWKDMLPLIEDMTRVGEDFATAALAMCAYLETICQGAGPYHGETGPTSNNSA